MRGDTAARDTHKTQPTGATALPRTCSKMRGYFGTPVSSSTKELKNALKRSLVSFMFTSVPQITVRLRCCPPSLVAPAPSVDDCVQGTKGERDTHNYECVACSKGKCEGSIEQLTWQRPCDAIPHHGSCCETPNSYPHTELPPPCLPQWCSRHCHLPSLLASIHRLAGKTYPRFVVGRAAACGAEIHLAEAARRAPDVAARVLHWCARPTRRAPRDGSPRDAAVRQRRARHREAGCRRAYRRA